MIAALDALVVGVAFLVALFALSQVVRPLLVNVLSRAPFIGSWLASNVDSGLASFQRSINAPAAAAVPLLTDLLNGLAYWGRAFFQDVEDFVNSLPSALDRLSTLTVPALISAATAGLQGLISAARADAASLVQAAEAAATAGLSALQVFTQGLVDAARNEAASLFTTAENDAAALVRVAESDAGALFQQAQADLTSAISTVETDLGNGLTAVRQLATQIAYQAGLDVQAAEQRAAAALGDLSGTINRDINAIDQQLAAQPAEFQANLSKEIKNLENSAPWQAIEALVGAGETALTTQTDEMVKALHGGAVGLLSGSAELKQRLQPAIDSVFALIRNAAK